MLGDYKIRSPEKTFSNSEKSFSNDSNEDISTVFRDLQVSALTKAVSISPVVTNVTLGVQTQENQIEDDSSKENQKCFPEDVLHSSTPTKNKPSSLSSQPVFEKIKQKVENLSPIGLEKGINLENNFSYRKLLSEIDVQRRLTVDKVMRERIQNMYDTGKLIRDSLEHLKQTRQEEAIARRLLLERKILDDIHEQEILNKPKREAQWAKDNLKEAQRIQERDQRVKEAEEEARKKFESILEKRNQIFLDLKKEYYDEYKSMMESLNSSKDYSSISQFGALHWKTVKESTATCESLFNKDKNDISEEDIEHAKKQVETMKIIYEAFSKTVCKSNEEDNNKKEKEKTKTEEEQEEVQKKPEKDESPKSDSALVSDTETITLKPSVMIESHHQKSSLQQSGGQKNAEESKTSLVVPGSLKRKAQKAVPISCKKKSLPSESHEEGIKIDHPKNALKNKLTASSVGFLKSQRKSLSNSSDVYEKGDIQRLKNKYLNSLRKKFKRVRFSDSTEIIDCNYFCALSDIPPAHVRGSEVLPEPKQHKTLSITAIPRHFLETSSINKQKYLSDCFDAKTLENYLNLKVLLQSCEKNIEPLLSDDSMKRFRFNCQKAVNIPVNAISPVSGPHLCDKYQKLYNLLSGKPVEVGDTKVTATQHPLGILYCKYLLAKKFVRQGDLTVSSKPDAAFSIAAVLASLWVDFPDFGQLVLAHFQSVCPYLAPVFMPQVEKQSDEEYHKSLGYHYSQNGEVEKQDSFLKRMSGIMRLYSALLISKVRQPGKMNPLGLSEGWRWISALLNLEPRPDICATLLYDFLEVAGNEMFRAYGAQFKKVLAYICQEYFPKLEKVTPSGAGGPMVRLEGFLQKILKEESIPQPHGVLPHNFW